MFLQVLRETLAVMIDYRHMSGFKMQAMIVQELLSAIDSGSSFLDPTMKLHNE